MRIYSLSGATIISRFLDLIRKKDSSSLGSNVSTNMEALLVRDDSNAAWVAVCSSLNVDSIAAPVCVVEHVWYIWYGMVTVQQRYDSIK
jgi:hypothetical protein